MKTLEQPMKNKFKEVVAILFPDESTQIKNKGEDAIEKVKRALSKNDVVSASSYIEGAAALANKNKDDQIALDQLCDIAQMHTDMKSFGAAFETYNLAANRLENAENNEEFFHGLMALNASLEKSFISSEMIDIHGNKQAATQLSNDIKDLYNAKLEEVKTHLQNDKPAPYHE
jgi:hypothetical protein